MRIAINTRFLLPTKMEGFGWYTYEIVSRIVKNHPEHEFILFFDRKYDEKFVFGKNVTPVILYPQARHPFLFYIWFELSIKRALKKYKADIFFSPDGYLSLGSKCKQIAVMHDLNFEHNPKDLKWLMLKYYRYFFPKFAKKAAHILTVSNYSKQDICKTYSIPESKVTVVWNGASDVFKPVDESIKEAIRIKYSNGKPYFLFVGALHPRKNVGRLIKAFEKYKLNHPESEDQLVIVGTELWTNSASNIQVDSSLKSTIHFTGHIPLNELANIMGAAKIFTFVPYFEGFGIPLVEAMKCGTPILSGDKTSLPEVAGEAALYCDPFNVDDIYEKLATLAADQPLREKLGENGVKRSEQFSWDFSAEKVWEIIEKELR